MKLTEKQAKSMRQQLKEIPDTRKERGKRHSVVTVLAIAICAMLSGGKNYRSLGEWAKRASQNLLKRLGCRYNDEEGRYIAPSEPTIRRVLKTVPAAEVEKVLNEWVKRLGLEEDESAIAVDGKVLKGARDKEGKKTVLISAVLHQSGVTLNQVRVDPKSNEINAVEPLLKDLEITGRVVTLDALHTQRKTAEYIVTEKKAHYLFTVKGNQPTLKADIGQLQMESQKVDYETTNKGHGRIETRRIWVSSALNDYIDFPHVGQVYCIQRQVYDCKKKIERTETVYGITDLKPTQAKPEQLLKLNRGHWAIENSSHYVRDVTFGEDTSQIRTGSGPQVMACLRNFAIGTLRVLKKTTNIASALRELASKPHLALRLVGL